MPEESYFTSEASSISESNIRDITGTIELGDGRRARVDHHGNLIQQEKNYKLEFLVEIMSEHEEESEGSDMDEEEFVEEDSEEK